MIGADKAFRRGFWEIKQLNNVPVGLNNVPVGQGAVGEEEHGRVP
jgi:hypothetical protein